MAMGYLITSGYIHVAVRNSFAAQKQSISTTGRESFQVPFHDTTSLKVRPKFSYNPSKTCHIWVVDLPYTSSKMLP